MQHNPIIQKITDHCSGKPNVSPEFPFGNDVLVFKVQGKMFALLHLVEPFRINLKCDPVYAALLREKYKAVIPGYHMNKKHWNTVHLDDSIDLKLLFEWIDDSYALVTKRKK